MPATLTFPSVLSQLRLALLIYTAWLWELLRKIRYLGHVSGEMSVGSCRSESGSRCSLITFLLRHCWGVLSAIWLVCVEPLVVWWCPITCTSNAPQRLVIVLGLIKPTFLTQAQTVINYEAHSERSFNSEYLLMLLRWNQACSHNLLYVVRG